MRSLSVLVCLAASLWAQTVRVSVIHNEVWVTRKADLGSGTPRQLTHDGKASLPAALSSRGDRIAYFEECRKLDGCSPSIVSIDLEGDRLKVLQARPSLLGSSEEACASINRITWLHADSVVGVECHATPSSSEYVEVDITTGKTVRELLGGGFTSSPNGQFMAHVGPVMHFAPPPVKSNFFFLDNTVLYPLPKGTKPAEVKPLDQLFLQSPGGVHSFGSGFAWSPNSRRIAFVDCVFEWVETGEINGSAERVGHERNRRLLVSRCLRHRRVHVVPPSGRAAEHDLRQPCGMDR